tara:strand:+ start:641 stop:1036 length:396 start_codon:yes stop_codon:yes gene_type:complete
MASELRVNTLKDASGNNSIATSVVFNGSAKAWIDMPGDLASISDSFNISSLDDDGTGDGGINLTSSMGSANYTITASSEDNGASASITVHDLTQGTKTASGYDFEVVFVNAGANRTNTDCETMSAIHGDLA